MILSDGDIKKRILDGSVVVTSDLSQDEVMGQIYHASMDVRLGNKFKLYRHAHVPYLDPKNLPEEGALATMVEIPDGEAFFVQPGEFVLGVTREHITVPNDLVVRVEGRSSLGRLGIIVHATAGFIDPGFSGTITLEISNLNRLPIALYPGMRIGQFAFMLMTSPCDVPYAGKSHSKYMGQIDPEPTRITKDPELMTKKDITQ